MKRTGVQRLALASILFLILLIFAGAVVRVTGSGLGCPDWPTCWGQLIPPTSVEQVDQSYLERKLPRFKKSAKRFGRDPDEISVEKLMAEYDPLQTWIEFVNRLLALPVLLSTFLLMIACIRAKTCKGWGIASFALVIISALTGIVVVASGLNAGVVTIHMALAFAQLFVLVYILWAGGKSDDPRTRFLRTSRPQVMVLLACVMIEWALGSQIREMTDNLMKEFGTASRPQWITQIEDSWVYLIHRSFSWTIFVAAIWLAWREKWQGFVPRLTLAIVIALMIMGLVLSQKGIHAVVQVLHVGLAGILVSTVFYWWLAAKSRKAIGQRA